jgi:hypothetical protein
VFLKLIRGFIDMKVRIRGIVFDSGNIYFDDDGKFGGFLGIDELELCDDIKKLKEKCTDIIVYICHECIEKYGLIKIDDWIADPNSMCGVRGCLTDMSELEDDGSYLYMEAASECINRLAVDQTDIENMEFIFED